MTDTQVAQQQPAQPNAPVGGGAAPLPGQRVALTRVGVRQLFNGVIKSELVAQQKKKSPLIFWHKANFSINLLDTIEEFKQQEQVFVRRGLARRKNNIGEPSRYYDCEGIRYSLKWYVFSPSENPAELEKVADIDKAPCPLYLFIGNVILPGYAYVQVFEEGPAPVAVEEVVAGEENIQTDNDLLIASAEVTTEAAQ